MTYDIYLNGKVIGTVSGLECVYETWHKVLELAEMLGCGAELVDITTGEIVEYTE